MSNPRDINLDVPEVRELWKAVFLAVIGRDTYDAAVTVADLAVSDMLERIRTKD